MAIPYTKIPKSSRLLLDYLYNFDAAADLFTAAPFSLSSYLALAGRLRQSEDMRGTLARILARQNKGFGSSPSVFENIERLKRMGTFAVVTGQQVGLFSGPVFTIYKALTAIRLAQWLSEQGLQCVPVFWLANEDHDLEEVAQTAVLNDDCELLPLGDLGERPSPHSPVGRVRLTTGIQDTLHRLEAALPAGNGRDSVMSDLRHSYRPGNTWSQAFGQLLARLFERWGVILVDSLDSELHQLSVHTYLKALEGAASIRRMLHERSENLVRRGYHAQVHVAEDSTLLFMIHDGDRLPLRENNSEFSLGNGERHSLADLKTLLDNDPSRFSANVLMRPVVQDALLPTLASVAGPSELAYLGQAQSIYEVFGRPMPIVYPRAGFTLIDRKTQRRLEKYQLSVEDVWQGEEHLNRKIAASGLAEGWSDRFDQSERELAALLQRLRKDIETLDPTLLDTLKHAEEKMKYQLERLRGKLSRAGLQRSDLLVRHQQALRGFLFPQKDLQERQVCGVYFLACAGYELLDRLLNEMPVHSPDHQILQY